MGPALYDRNNHLYHNSFYHESAFFDQPLMGLDYKDLDISQPESQQVTLSNNAWHMTKFTGPIGGDADGYAGSSLLAHVRRTGQVWYEGSNYLFNDYDADNLIADNTDAAVDARVTITGEGNLTVNNVADPAYTTTTFSWDDPAVSGTPVFDLTPGPGSPLIDAAGALPLDPASKFPVFLQPVDPSLGGGAEVRSATNDLGAIEAN